MTCPGRIDEAEKQRLQRLNSLFGPPPHNATCSICGRSVAAYLIGSEWVLKRHDAVILRNPKGKGTKQPSGKLVVRGRGTSSYSKVRKAGTKRIVRKATRRVSNKIIFLSQGTKLSTKRMARKTIRRKR